MGHVDASGGIDRFGEDQAMKVCSLLIPPYPSLLPLIGRNKTRMQLVIVLLFFLLFWGCHKGKEEKQERIFPVTTERVATQTLHDTEKLVGTVEGIEQAWVYPKTAGKVARLLIPEGSPVRKGSPILEIDRDEIGFEFQPYPLLSPLEGSLARVTVEKGEQVDPQNPIALVARTDICKLKAAVSERVLPKLRIGQEAIVEVDAYPDRTFTGRVRRISTAVDPETRTGVVEVTIPNDDRLLIPGMFAQAEVVTRVYKEIPVVPEKAILYQADGTFVFVVQEGKGVKKRVELGIKSDGFIAIERGLAIGEEVIVTGQHQLEDGSSVHVVQP